MIWPSYCVIAHIQLTQSDNWIPNKVVMVWLQILSPIYIIYVLLCQGNYPSTSTTWIKGKDKGLG